MSVYNMYGQLVNTQEELELKQQLSTSQQQLSSTKQQLQNAENQIAFQQGQLNQANRVIANQQNQINLINGKLNEKNTVEYQRQYYQNANGDVFTLEPNNKKQKYIGNIRITDVDKICVADNDGKSKVYYQVSYKSYFDTILKSELISEENLRDKKIANYFRAFRYDSHNRSIVNDYLYIEICNHIENCSQTNRNSYKIPSLAGFYQSSENAVSFYSSSSEIYRHIT